MNVVFRVDSSLAIGTGHVMRCLTLANELRFRGHSCTFICKDLEGNISELIQVSSFKLFLIPCNNAEDSLLSNQDDKKIQLEHSHWLDVSQEEDAKQCLKALEGIEVDWIVVDHYGISDIWEKVMYGKVKQLMVIDDLADRSHYCDVLLDQNYGSLDTTYEPLISKGAKVFTGLDYSLLRPEFLDERKKSLARRKKTGIKRLLVNMGGVDKDNITAKVLCALENTRWDISPQIVVVVGGSYPHVSQLRRLIDNSRLDIELLQSVSNMAEIMSGCDLAIGAAGSTTWERFCLGLPSILMVIAKNQEGAMTRLAAQGLALQLHLDYLGDELPALIESLTPSVLTSLTKKSSELVKGNGSLLIADYLEEKYGSADSSNQGGGS